MSCVNTLLHKILNSNIDSCCSLCFEVVSEEVSLFNLQDEVFLDTLVSEKIYNILVTVIGPQVLDTLNPKYICQKCTKTAISSYKFIKMCKNYVLKLSYTADCVLKHMKNVKDNKKYNTLFLTLKEDNYSLNIIYDKKKCYYRNDSQTRFQQLLKKSCNTAGLVRELDNNSDVLQSSLTKTVQKQRTVQFIQSTDIIHEKDDDDHLIKCKYCSKVFPSMLKMKQHYFRVHAPKDYKCSKCARSFSSSVLLSRHTRHSHCTVVCSQCGKTYNNVYSLRRHEVSHKLQLICQTCGKKYKGKRSFNNHIEQKLCQKLRKSNADAKFTCDYCHKKYSQKSALSVHIRLEHENGKALICDRCGKKLSSVSRLKEHTIIHTKEKNFQCNICGGKFVTKVSLLYHTRLHTGEKPYKCDHCNLNFLSASRRSQHVKRHHSASNLKCDICHREYKEQSCLTRHRKRHFNMSSKIYHNSGGNFH